MQEESPQRTVSICILATKLSGRRRCTDNKKSTEREGEGYSWPQGQAAPRHSVLLGKLTINLCNNRRIAAD